MSGDIYTLTILSCEAGKCERDWEDPGGNLEYPSHYQEITYTVEPDITPEELTIQDCEREDQPRRKGAGDNDADPSVHTVSTVLVPMYAMEGGKSPNVRSAYSSLRFGPVDRAEWRAVFHIKKKDFQMQADLVHCP